MRITTSWVVPPSGHRARPVLRKPGSYRFPIRGLCVSVVGCAGVLELVVGLGGGAARSSVELVLWAGADSTEGDSVVGKETSRGFVEAAVSVAGYSIRPGTETHCFYTVIVTSVFLRACSIFPVR